MQFSGQNGITLFDCKIKCLITSLHWRNYVSTANFALNPQLRISVFLKSRRSTFGSTPVSTVAPASARPSLISMWQKWFKWLQGSGTTWAGEKTRLMSGLLKLHFDLDKINVTIFHLVYIFYIWCGQPMKHAEDGIPTRDPRVCFAMKTSMVYFWKNLNWLRKVHWYCHWYKFKIGSKEDHTFVKI